MHRHPWTEQSKVCHGSELIGLGALPDEHCRAPRSRESLTGGGHVRRGLWVALCCPPHGRERTMCWRARVADDGGQDVAPGHGRDLGHRVHQAQQRVAPVVRRPAGQRVLPGSDGLQPLDQLRGPGPAACGGLGTGVSATLTNPAATFMDTASNQPWCGWDDVDVTCRFHYCTDAGRLCLSVVHETGLRATKI